MMRLINSTIYIVMTLNQTQNIRNTDDAESVF